MMSSRAVRTIIRTVKDRSNPYVVLNTSVLTESGLSWKAKGLMGYFLSRPDDWHITIADLARRSTDGVKAVYTGLRELIETGYVRRTTVRDAQGRIVSWEYLVYEKPQEVALCSDESPLSQNGEVALCSDESPLRQNLQVENRQVGGGILSHTLSSAKAKRLNTKTPSTEKNQVLKILKNNDRNRAAVAKDSTVYGTAGARANAAPPAAAVVVVPPLEEDSGPCDPHPHGDTKRILTRYREITGLDDLRPRFVETLISRHGIQRIEEKLAVLDAWLRDKRVAGERITPLRVFLRALLDDWPLPQCLSTQRDEVAVTRRMLDEYEQTAPAEAVADYLREMRAVLRIEGGGP